MICIELIVKTTKVRGAGKGKLWGRQPQGYALRAHLVPAPCPATGRTTTGTHRSYWNAPAGSRLSGESTRLQHQQQWVSLASVG